MKILFRTQKKITDTIKDRAKVLGKLVDADDKQKDIARVFWDADEFYYENTIHEAGDFLRRQRNKWHEIDFKGVGNYWSVKKDQFNIIIDNNLHTGEICEIPFV